MGILDFLKYYRNDEVVCPHCNHSHNDSWEFDDDDDEATCESCGKDFHLQIETQRKYTTSKEEII